MAAPEHFSQSLQQDLLTLLCHSDEHGRVISRVLSPNLFEGDYRTIAERAIEYWNQQNKAPRQHTADLLSDILENPADRRANTMRRLLVGMFEIQTEINADFVLKSMSAFMRVQRAKETILHAAELLDARGISALEDVEADLNQFLRERQSLMDPGLRLNEIDRVLAYLDNVQNEFKTGIRELDDGFIVPMRGKLYNWLAPSGYGKTWSLIQCGKTAFVLRKRVLHISYEIEAEEVAQRYYQALFAASKRDDEVEISKLLRKPNSNDIKGISKVTINPPFNSNSAAIKEELQTRVNHFGATRFGNMMIKSFPTRSQSVEQLDAYIEQLIVVEKFIPEMLIVDYPGIMKTDAKNHRISLGRVIEDLRGLARRRNVALVVAHQTSKASVDADMVRATHVSEDWSAVMTSDFIVTYSQTATENQFGLARLYVAKGRSEQDKFGVLITQNYKTGQFVLESMRLPKEYSALMERIGKKMNIREDADDSGPDDE